MSVSQLKKANASLAQRAGNYLLGIKDEYQSDSLALGLMFEHKLFTGKDDYDHFMQDVYDREKMLKDYDALVYNSKGLEIPSGEKQMKIEGQLFGVDFLGYADIADDKTIYDIKSIGRTSMVDSKQRNMWSGLTYMEEYELQMRAYMKVTGYKKSQIIAVGKFLYKDERHDNLKINIDWSDELDQRMSDKFVPLIDKMSDLYSKYGDG